MSILRKKQFKLFTTKMKIELVEKIMNTPEEYSEDALLGSIAEQFIEPIEQELEPIQLNESAVDLKVFGRPLIKSNAYQQMQTAMKLPIVRRGACLLYTSDAADE